METLKFASLVKLEEPRKTTHHFVGGSLDGQSKEATEHYVMTEKVIVTINSENYQYAGNDTFKYIGKTHKAVFPKPTLKQKIVNWLLK